MSTTADSAAAATSPEVLARLVPAETLAGEDGLLLDVPAWQFGANLALVLCRAGDDAAGSVSHEPLGRAEAEALGNPEDLLPQGVRRLVAHLLDPGTEISAVPLPETDGEQEHPRWRLSSPDPLLASGALFLGDLLDAVLPSLDTGAGVLLALPDARSLLVREVTEGTDLYEGVNGMAAAAVEWYASASEPVSPFLFLVHQGRAVPITSAAAPAEGEDPQRPRIRIDPPEHLLERIRRNGPSASTPTPAPTQEN